MTARSYYHALLLTNILIDSAHICNETYCNSSKTSQRPQKPLQGYQLPHRRFTNSSPRQPNFSCRFSARSKSREGQPEATAWLERLQFVMMVVVWGRRSRIGIG